MSITLVTVFYFLVFFYCFTSMEINSINHQESFSEYLAFFNISSLFIVSFHLIDTFVNKRKIDFHKKYQSKSLEKKESEFPDEDEEPSFLFVLILNGPFIFLGNIIVFF